MRRRTLLLFITVTALTVAGCGGATKTVTESSSTPTAPSTAQASAPATAPPSDEPSIAELGDPVVVTGSISSDSGADQGLDLTIRIRRVVDNAKNSMIPASSVEAGTRWVRALVEIENQSPDTYSIADGLFSMVDDAGGEATENFSSAPWHGLGNGKLLTGDQRIGWVAFLVKKGHRPDEVRWQPVNGADPVYRWAVTTG